MSAATAEHSDSHFCTKHLDADLGRRSVRGGAVTIAGQGCKFVLNLASTAVLARLLTPHDFGLIAMVMIVTGFVHLFRDLGLTMATIQRRQISQRQVSSLFWLNVILGAAMMAITAGAAPLIAWFYDEPQLLWATVVLSVSFLFSGLSAQHQALITRQMRFGALAGNEILSMTVGIGVALIAAKLGAGFWALVFMQVAMAVAGCAIWWVQCRWRPDAPHWTSEAGSMVAFGGHLTGFNVVNYLGRNVDSLLIGRLFGPHQLGLYSKAYQLLLLPLHQINGPMTRVAVPALSRLQDNPRRYRTYYRRALLLLCAVSMPVVALLFATADQAIELVLGKQWLEATLLFQLLAPAAFVGTFHVGTGWVYVSLGQTDRQLRMGIVVTLITLIAFAIGAPWGAVGVAVAYSASTCLTRYPTIVYCFRTTPLRPGDLLGAIWRPALVSLLSAAVILIARPILLPLTMNLTISFITSVALYAISYCLLWQIFPEGRQLSAVAMSLLTRSRARRNRPTKFPAATSTVPAATSAVS